MGEFAETIKKARQERGLTQAELARLAGVEGPYISQIEKGEKVPSIAVAGRLAGALSLDRERLINLTLKEKAPEEAKDLFREAAPRFPRLRELLLARCENREELEPELARGSFTRFEEWLIRLLFWGLAREVGGISPEELEAALSAASEEEPSLVKFQDLVREELVSWRVDFSQFNIEMGLARGERLVISPYERPWEAGQGSGVTVARAGQIPVVGLVEAGRGGFYDDQGYPVGQGMYSVARPFDITDPNAYGVEVSGDSMVPRLYDKDVVIASPARTVSSGDLVVARLADDEVMIKRVRFKGDLVILESVNPAYEPRIVSRAEVKFLHRVVWIKPR